MDCADGGLQDVRSDLAEAHGALQGFEAVGNLGLVPQRAILVVEQYGFARYKADWTSRNEEIRLELASHGRAGVPMYLVYDPNRPTSPTLLPELLTVDLLVEALRKSGT